MTKLCGRHTYTTEKKSRSESEMGKLSDQAEEMSENCPKEVKAGAKSYMWHSSLAFDIGRERKKP